MAGLWTTASPMKRTGSGPRHSRPRHFAFEVRRYETYCGVRVLSFCVMTNHFHILLEVPKRPPPENLPTDHDLVERLRMAECSYGAETLAQQLAALRNASRVTEAERSGSVCPLCVSAPSSSQKAQR